MQLLLSWLGATPRAYYLIVRERWCPAVQVCAGSARKQFRKHDLLAVCKTLAILVSYQALGRLARAPLQLTTRTGVRVTHGLRTPQGPSPHGLAAAAAAPAAAQRASPRLGRALATRPRRSRRGAVAAAAAPAGRTRRRAAAAPVRAPPRRRFYGRAAKPPPPCASPRTSPSTRRSA